jgi:hypothetical protein
VKKGVAHSITYDHRNNIIWGWDPFTDEFTRWRNVGLPVPFDPPKPSAVNQLAFSTSPLHRLEALAAENSGDGRYEAALIMCHLDRLSSPYGPPSQTMAESKSADEIEVVSAGFSDGCYATLSIRGQICGQPKRGFNLCVLNDLLKPVKFKSFDTNENPADSERLADFIDTLSEGTIVLVAVLDEASSNLSSRGRQALTSLGASNIDRLRYRDSFAMIGRKGANPGSVPQRLVGTTNGVASVRHTLPTPFIPLCIEANVHSLSALVELIDMHKDLLTTTPSGEEASILLSALRILTVNLFQLSRGESDSSKVEAIFPSESRAKILAFLLDVIENTSNTSAFNTAVSQTAFLTLTGGLNILYPRPADRCSLLTKYLNQFVEGSLTPSQQMVLELLLRQMSDSSSLSSLLDTQESGSGKKKGKKGKSKRRKSQAQDGGDEKKEEQEEEETSSANQLLDSLLHISNKSTLKTLENMVDESASQDDTDIGNAAVQMLGTLCNHMLSQASQKIISASDAESADAGASILSEMVKQLCSRSADLLVKGMETSDALMRKEGHDVTELHGDVEEILKLSPVGALLPVALSVSTLLVENHGKKMFTRASNLTSTLNEVMVNLKPLLDKLPAEKKYVKATVERAPKNAVQIHESKHDYDSNTDEMIDISFPGAERIRISFDEQTRTEQGYDYVIFWTSRSKTEKCHPLVDKYTGRNGSENWPGFGGRDDLIIESDYCCLEWHTDGSGEDWGWRMTATGEFKAKASASSSSHWMVSLDRLISDCGSTIASLLIKGTPWGGALETSNASWMENELLGKGSEFKNFDDISHLSPEDQFLHDLIDNVEGSHAQHLAQAMRRIIAEDQGNIDSINRAVWATCAALIKLNGLVVESIAIGEGTRKEPPSSNMKKVWRAAQKMRQYFTLGDFAQAVSNDNSLPGPPTLGRSPSVYQGADDSAVSFTAEKVVERAKFLLTLPPPERVTKAGKKRWQMLSKAASGSMSPTPSHDSTEDQEASKFDLLVQEVNAAEKVKEMLAHRRKVAEKRKAQKEASTTERALQFLQSHVNVIELEEVREMRDQRAQLRVQGLELGMHMIESAATLSSSAWVLSKLTSAIRDTIHPSEEDEASHQTVHPIHYLAGVEGCSRAHAQELHDKFASFFITCINTYRANSETVLEGSTLFDEKNELARNEKNLARNVAIGALRACMIDYNISDHTFLNDSGIISVLEPLLRCEDVTLRSVGWSCFELLLLRCVGLEGQKHSDSLEETTEFGKSLIALLVREMDRASSAVINWNASNKVENVVPEALKDVPCSTLVSGLRSLSASNLGLSVPHTSMGLNHAFSFWLNFPDPSKKDGSKKEEEEKEEKQDERYGIWGKIEVGDSVMRGPDWQPFDDDDGGDGNLGSVTQMTDETVTVRWTASNKMSSYTYGGERDVRGIMRRVYEVVKVTEGLGGALYSKGAINMLTEEDQALPWSFFNFELHASQVLRFSAVASENSTFNLWGSKKLSPDTWYHVAYVQDKAQCRMYVNGELDTSGTLAGSLTNPSKGADMHVVESPHPYRDNMDEYWTVEVAGAESYSIVFDAQTRTEHNYDYLRVYKDSSHSDYWGENQYTGGRGGSSSNWPGLNGAPPLLIPASSFVVYFHSDGSNNDWGFKMICTPTIPRSDNDEDDITVTELNSFPLYIGQTPSHIAPYRGFTGSVFQMNLFKEALNDGQVTALAKSSSQPPSTLNIPSEQLCLDVLGLMNRCGKAMRSLAMGGARSLMGPHVVSSIVTLMQEGTPSVRTGAYRLASVIFPDVSLDMVNVQAQQQGFIGEGQSFVQFMIHNIGSTLNFWAQFASVRHDEEVFARASVEENIAVITEQIALLRAMSGSEDWCAELRGALDEGINALPVVIADLRHQAESEGETNRALSTLQTDMNALNAIYAFFALLGGSQDALCQGSTAYYVPTEEDSMTEECVILAPCYPPEISKDDKKGAAVWEGLSALGDAMVIIAQSSPDEAKVVPRTSLTPKPRPLPEAFTTMLGDYIEGFKGLFREVIDIEWTETREVYVPIASNQTKVEEVESPHPYADNMDDYWNLDFPGADEITISFDSQTTTELNYDYLRFYKDDSRTDFWGEDKYSGGRDGSSANWPGMGGRPPLKIPSDKVVVYFHSDGSNNDWGFKLTAKALCILKKDPPAIPPLVSLSTLASIQSSGLKALHHLFQNMPSLIEPLAENIGSLVNRSLRTLPNSSLKIEPKPLVFESAHPYSHNANDYEDIRIPGAKSLVITFDPQTRCESGCDYMRFYKDDSHGEYWGENQYTGGKDNGSHNWPSLQGRPPLIIPADHCVMHWHTDGSVNDWGWKFFVTPEFEGGSSAGASLDLLNDQLINYTRFLIEGLSISTEEAADLDIDESDFEKKRPEPASLYPSLTQKPLIDDGSGKLREAANIEEELDWLIQTTASAFSISESKDDEEKKGEEEKKEEHDDPNALVVNGRECGSVDLRVDASASSSTVCSVTTSDVLIPVGEENGDWVKVRVVGNSNVGWVLRRESDSMYLIPKQEQASDLQILDLGDDEDSKEEDAMGASSEDSFDIADSVSNDSLTGGAKTGSKLPSDVLRGHHQDLVVALTEMTQLSSLKYAHECVMAMVRLWPASIPFSVSTFGSLGNFMAFLRLTFSAEKDKISSSGQEGPALRMIKDKLLNVVRLEDSNARVMTRTLMTYAVQQLTGAVRVRNVLPPTKGKMKMIETPHPYMDNMDENWTVSIPGAKYLKLIFDKQSATEHGCDYAEIYTDSSRSTKIGSKITGRLTGGDKYWPGVNVEPLVVEQDSCYVRFYSDGSNTDWGFKLYVYGIFEEPTEEQKEEAKALKEGADSPDIEMACWILELMAKESSEIVRDILFSSETISTLRKYIESMPPKKKVWVIHLLTTMLQEVKNVNLRHESIQEIKKLADTLMDQATTQHDAEESMGSSNRSSYLQALVQATVVVESSIRPILSELESSAGSEGQVTLDSDTKEDVGDERETKEEEGEEEEEEFAHYQWSPDACGIAMDTLYARSTAKKGPRGGGNYSSVLAAFGYTSGVHKWNLTLRQFSGQGPIIGIAHSSINLNQNLGVDVHSVGWQVESQTLTVGGQSRAFGPKCASGDVITVTLNFNTKTLTFHRNEALVGVAIGPEGSGALFEMDLGSLPYHPAVCLCDTNDEVAIHEVGDGLMASDDRELPEWFVTIQQVVELLRSSANRQLPLSVLEREFLPQCKEKATVTIESSHPFNGEDIEREVKIDGASALEVHFDHQCHMGMNDDIRVIEPSGHIHTISSLVGGSVDPDSIDRTSIQVGDRVVRGPSWCWGDTDGGAGSFGVVEEIRPWKGKSDAGILTRWVTSNQTELYRWNYEGNYDLHVVERAVKSGTKLVRVKGDTLTFDVIPGPSSLTRQNSVGMDWSGCVQFTGDDSSVTIPYTPALECMGDFTVETWVYPSPFLAAEIAEVPIITRGTNMDGLLLSQFSLQLGKAGVCGNTTAVFSMMNAGLEEGVCLHGGSVPRGTWTHLAVTIQGSAITLYVNGMQEATRTFTGERLSSMEGDMLAAKDATGAHFFVGSLYDLRLWDEARNIDDIVQGKSSLADKSNEHLLLNLPLNDAGVTDQARDRANDDLMYPMATCIWDGSVPAPVMPEGVTWGFKAYVRPIFTVQRALHSGLFQEEYDELNRKYTSGDLSHDFALVRYVNDVALRKRMDTNQLLNCSWSDLSPTAEDLVKNPLVKALVDMAEEADGEEERKVSDNMSVITSAQIPSTMIEARFRLIQSLNRSLRGTLPFIDLGIISKKWSIAALLASCRGLIFNEVKKPIWKAALDATNQGGGEFELRLSRSRASKYSNMGLTDTEGVWSTFSQAFRQMHPMNPQSLRRSNKLYNCVFMGERSHDAGGPYRESWSMYCTELQSSALPLLIKTHNAREQIGRNREKWTLNPGATSDTQLEMFTFLGKIMGIAIRSEGYLALNLPSIVWKLLSNDQPTLDDLEAIDQMVLQSMDQVRNIDQQGVDADTFEDIMDLNFTVMTSDDRIVELKPNGTNIPVTFDTRNEYCDLVLDFRLHEFDRVAAAVRNGLSTIIPLRLLSLFTWDELELMVCGKPDIDVALLRANTEYSGVNQSDPFIRYFWQALEEFTSEERSMFLKFTWGRSRLPLTSEGFSQRFKIQGFHSNPPDSYFPVAHTCFFSLELPRYSSLEIMKERLRYAIYNCQAIDGDETGVGMQAASLGWEE